MAPLYIAKGSSKSETEVWKKREFDRSLVSLIVFMFLRRHSLNYSRQFFPLFNSSSHLMDKRCKMTRLTQRVGVYDRRDIWGDEVFCRDPVFLRQNSGTFRLCSVFQLWQLTLQGSHYSTRDETVHRVCAKLCTTMLIRSSSESTVAANLLGRVNAIPGLKVNQSINFSGITVFLTAYVLCSLRLFKLKPKFSPTLG